MTLRNLIIKSLSVFGIMLMSDMVSAQSMGGSTVSNVLIWIVAALVFFALIFVGDSFLKLQAKNVGVENSDQNYSLFPKLGEIFSPKLPDFTLGKKVHVLKKGHDIKLEGEASSSIDTSFKQPSHFAIKPTDFLGIAPIPKMLVAVGDNVKIGDPLFYDKKNEAIKFCAPVSGEVISITRGAKRAITDVVILADKSPNYRSYEAPNPATASREDLVNFLAAAGVWPMIKRRPYQLLAGLDETPRDIFISTFDTAPLAPDTNLFVAGREKEFQAGLDALSKLTDGSVYLGLDGKNSPAAAYSNATNVEKHYFHGKHPAGNVGVQIHHIKPIGAKDVVWTLGVQEVISIGTLFTKGQLDTERVVALVGDEFANPKHVKTYLGANIESIVTDNKKGTAAKVRYVSGDVLSGSQIEANGYLGFYDDQITSLAEGDYHEMFGWLLPLSPRPSVSRSMPGFLMPNFKYTADTNTHGEERAFVVTGQYEKVLPMDVYPQHLMKAIMMGDFERMEGLGIYELAPEDLALCEFTCTSKQPLQAILKDGHEMMLEQL